MRVQVRLPRGRCFRAFIHRQALINAGAQRRGAQAGPCAGGRASWARGRGRRRRSSAEERSGAEPRPGAALGLLAQPRPPAPHHGQRLREGPGPARLSGGIQPRRARFRAWLRIPGHPGASRARCGALGASAGDGRGLSRSAPRAGTAGQAPAPRAECRARGCCHCHCHCPCPVAMGPLCRPAAHLPRPCAAQGQAARRRGGSGSGSRNSLGVQGCFTQTGSRPCAPRGALPRPRAPILLHQN